MSLSAIFGFGVLGTATATVMRGEILIYDPNMVVIPPYLESKCTRVKEFPIADTYVICVPTDLVGDNDLDLRAVHNTLSKIKHVATVYIRSTLPIGACNVFIKDYPHLEIIYYPEFLREKHWLEDVISPDRVIMTCQEPPELFNMDVTKFSSCTHKEAEIVKLFSNAFLATKIAFFHEVKELCYSQDDVDYENVRKAIASDSRIGHSHTYLPLTISGKCLPKDLSAAAKVTNGGLLNAAMRVGIINNYHNRKSMNNN